MGLIKFDCADAAKFINTSEISNLEPYIKLSHGLLHDKSGAGSDYTGWVGLPSGHDKEEFGRIKACAKKIIGDTDILVVIGIGGSYLGAKAAIDALTHNFYGYIHKNDRKHPVVLYAGNNLSAPYLSDLLEVLEGREVSVNVISKSGTTTEPAVAFRIFKEFMEIKYGKSGASKRIYATTDKKNGALRAIADAEQYETFVIPDDVGGRFSVLTPVGLLPIAAAGADISEMLEGAAEAERAYSTPDLDKNGCYSYAAARNALHRKGYGIEVLANYEPNLHYMCEWWKQLFGESEGKDNKGIFPAAVDFTADLHSMGQYIQGGVRNLFETVLTVDKPRRNIDVKADPDNIDGLNFLSGRGLDYINKMASKGVAQAHVEGGVPVLSLAMPAVDAHSFGAAVYFFEKACAISGYLLGVNPFDQPGVELYKKNMFRLLGKPGY